MSTMLKSKDFEDLLVRFPPSALSHSRRVAVCCSIMCEYAAFLRPNDVPYGTNLALAAYLGGACHDVGKVLLPPLTAPDYMRHTGIGADFLDENVAFLSKAQAGIVDEMVRYHHERPDGGGFPNGLTAKDIPLTAGICALANMLDNWLWRKGAPPGDLSGVLEDFKEQGGVVFTESALICFEHAWGQLAAWYAKWRTLNIA